MSARRTLLLLSSQQPFLDALRTRLPAEQARDVAIMVRGDRSADLDAWAALVETLRRRHCVQLHYLQGSPHHDPPVCRALGRRCRLADGGQALDLPGLLAALGRMALLITDRYHGCVFALQIGTPVLPVASTTHKTDGLLDLLGRPVPVLPPLTGATLDAYQATIDAAWEWRAALSTRGCGLRPRRASSWIASMLCCSCASGRRLKRGDEIIAGRTTDHRLPKPSLHLMRTRP